VILNPTNDQRIGQTATLFALHLYQELANSLVINKFYAVFEILVTFGLVWVVKNLRMFGLVWVDFFGFPVWFGLVEKSPFATSLLFCNCLRDF
jgi:hypothetical protein